MFSTVSSRYVFVALCASVLLIFMVVSRRNLPVREMLKVIQFGDDGCNCDYKNYILGPGGHQDDPCLIDLVRKHFIVPPSTLPYNTNNTIGSAANPDIPSNREKQRILKKYLIDKSDPSYRGFFIDCGANDGEFISSTIHLEKEYGWNGLLVEADPRTYEQLRNKSRKAWSINAGACITPYAEKITFFTHPSQTGWGRITKEDNLGINNPTQIQCIPLTTMLAAINVTTVDFLSLDVEGLELEILKTIPFERIQFKVMMIEYWGIPGGKPVLEAFLKTKDYHYVKDIIDSYNGDSLYVHGSLVDIFSSEFVSRTVQNSL